MAKKAPAPLRTPDGSEHVLLHSCCAPCAGPIMADMQSAGIALTILFYNPNIHPLAEYELRKEENIRYAEKLGLPFIDLDYDKDNWFERVKGLEWEPERGARCTACFDMRFERSALYAVEHGFTLFTSTLGISRWKDMAQINGCGQRAAARYPQLQYWDYNWRKGGGSQRMIEIAKEEQFYQQEYCGCVYSLRDNNLHRIAQGREKIVRGVKFYGRDEVDKGIQSR
ncbi:epoxyqueuosine reductase QueH [Acidithiobacillus sp. CV18-2]|uniref:Epoxyqueuosine reductase QueH n=1 Tax=Igneacidithiobacillus copahuensis TaxID=2724909 RepID=A0AAE2YMT2_9PROT|nr:epoxyqueuosine reductase QueH [Igneacidithiobacillus copahuensis]MBU2753089.1 epoxyqueuosine reductase QueH [Acidithiobacillus sp. CV18-3]MBU2756115.1 epoxyqueuosine reductase QueH [Acidithiobacillus sp. BN09-2]MBU2776665.1 epoxyqueuosine reductase QueH [Acidithiobacillus sp. CV18-2]MBU2797139.1 epoxyqueuosine reductase QueH [Acidithiobacillus sp. VAN18-2]MBU2799245.1 epoxyqueuosine reductase QueH [Acidithiobacillus sp. VAN18-4]UTV81512.1 epoxyqueuosine reductase QueH [Acidithiobacillus sp